MREKERGEGREGGKGETDRDKHNRQTYRDSIVRQKETDTPMGFPPKHY